MPDGRCPEPRLLRGAAGAGRKTGLSPAADLFHLFWQTPVLSSEPGAGPDGCSIQPTPSRSLDVAGMAKTHENQGLGAVLIVAQSQIHAQGAGGLEGGQGPS